MKLRTILVGMLLSMMVTPAFPCGPMNSGTGMSNNSGGGTGQTTTQGGGGNTKKRQKWVKKRMRYLERQHAIDTIVLSGSPKSASDKVKREYMMNRFEYLAHKSKQSGLSRKEYAEFRLLFEALGPRSR